MLLHEFYISDLSIFIFYLLLTGLRNITKKLLSVGGLLKGNFPILSTTNLLFNKKRRYKI